MLSGRVEPISSHISLIVKKSFGRLVIPSRFPNCNMDQIKPISNKKNGNSTRILWEEGKWTLQGGDQQCQLHSA